MKMSIEMEPVSRRDLSRSLKVAPEKTVNGIRKWVNTTSARTERTAVQEAPVDKGQLEGSIHSKFAVRGLEATVQPNVKHALYVHEGTGLYGPYKRPITPKRGRALSWESGGNRVFARSVKGIKPNKFMDRTYTKVRPQADSDAVKILDEIVRSL